MKLYTATVSATGGRHGRVSSDDGLLALDLASPKELGGPGGATNPEQLFAAGYAACFEGAMRFVAREGNIPISSIEIRTAVTLNKWEAGDFSLSVEIDVAIGGLDQATSEKLVERTHATCPYSKAIRDNVPVVTRVAAV
jgi:Ohr subfamily peroxiredoxin